MEKKMNVENLYGRVVSPAKSCNNCPNDKNCCKIEVPGIGLLCLADKDTAYTALQEKYDGVVEESAAMSKELSELRSKNSTLEASNKHMEAELERVRKANQLLNELNDERLLQIQELKNRGFWARVFNRQISGTKELKICIRS